LSNGDQQVRGKGGLPNLADKINAINAKRFDELTDLGNQLRHLCHRISILSIGFPS